MWVWLIVPILAIRILLIQPTPSKGAGGSLRFSTKTRALFSWTTDGRESWRRHASSVLLTVPVVGILVIQWRRCGGGAISWVRQILLGCLAANKRMLVLVDDGAIGRDWAPKAVAVCVVGGLPPVCKLHYRVVVEHGRRWTAMPADRAVVEGRIG